MISENTIRENWEKVAPDNIVYENHEIWVFHNNSGEIFARTKSNGVTVRITPNYDSFTITAYRYQITPSQACGLPAFEITKN